MITDPTLLRIGEAVRLTHRDERAAARDLFTRLWTEIGGDDGDPLRRCTLAHAMADAQDDPTEELLWDRTSAHWRPPPSSPTTRSHGPAFPSPWPPSTRHRT